jgi:hypothetical protein
MFLRCSVALTALMLAACSSGSGPTQTPPPAPPTPPAPTLTIAPLQVTFDGLGDFAEFRPTVTGLTNPVLTWTTSDSTVAQMADAGVVRSRRPGTAQITVSTAGLSAVATVTVLPLTSVTADSAITRYTGGASGREETVSAWVRNPGGRGAFYVELRGVSAVTGDSLTVVSGEVQVTPNVVFRQDLTMNTAFGNVPAIRYVRIYSRSAGEASWRAAAPVYVH